MKSSVKRQLKTREVNKQTTAGYCDGIHVSGAHSPSRDLYSKLSGDGDNTENKMHNPKTMCSGRSEENTTTNSLGETTMNCVLNENETTSARALEVSGNGDFAEIKVNSSKHIRSEESKESTTTNALNENSTTNAWKENVISGALGENTTTGDTEEQIIVVSGKIQKHISVRRRRELETPVLKDTKKQTKLIAEGESRCADDVADNPRLKNPLMEYLNKSSAELDKCRQSMLKRTIGTDDSFKLYLEKRNEALNLAIAKYDVSMQSFDQTNANISETGQEDLQTTKLSLTSHLLSVS
ncbi:hypothetical protein SNE40_010008 [Patella caerulea]|uniref:Uncharacterized protein n=1 Tax=Patella caerulea TaxID=87958 RepID=A0AAN8PTU6_PATCE